MIIKMSIRNLLKNKLYYLIFILGLAIMVTAFILISFFVRYEYYPNRSKL